MEVEQKLHEFHNAADFVIMAGDFNQFFQEIHSWIEYTDLIDRFFPKCTNQHYTHVQPGSRRKSKLDTIFFHAQNSPSSTFKPLCMYASEGVSDHCALFAAFSTSNSNPKKGFGTRSAPALFASPNPNIHMVLAKTVKQEKYRERSHKHKALPLV